MTKRSWLPSDAIDTRAVFWIYSVVAGSCGILLLTGGPTWVEGDAGMVRLFGAMLITAALCAIGFARTTDPPSRHRGLFWFSIAHLAMIPAVPGQLGQVFMGVIYGLFYVWLFAGGEISEPIRLVPVTLFGKRSSTPSRRVRTAYERYVRHLARQEERHRLARDLHDAIKQQIFVIRTAAATAQVRFDSDRVGARKAIEQVSESARDAMTEMEVMLDQLQAAPLENTGLGQAINKQCEALGHRTGAKVDFAFGELPDEQALSPGAHEAFLRVVQEALSNIARHARASNVDVGLEQVYDHVVLTIRDDGRGFDPNRARRGMGITSMRKRAEEFDGSFELSSTGARTEVRFALPCKTNIPSLERTRRDAFLMVVFVAAVTLFGFWTRWSNIAGVWLVLGSIGAAHLTSVWLRSRKQHEAAR